MSVYKSPGADLRRRYPLYVQLGLALSLGVLAAAFSIPFSTGNDDFAVVDPRENVPLDVIPPTEQPPEVPPPPPPPAPPPPVEVLDEVVVADVPLDALEFDPFETPRLPSPPPRPNVAAPPVVPEPDTDEVIEFLPLEDQPQLIGGLAGLDVAYPEMERRAGVEGRVVVQFVVDEEGVPRDLVVLRSVSAGLDAAALDAVREARFTPGLQRGRPVKVRATLPVTFRLAD